MTGKELKTKLEQSSKTLTEIATLLGMTPQALNARFIAASVKVDFARKALEIAGLPAEDLPDGKSERSRRFDELADKYIARLEEDIVNYERINKEQSGTIEMMRLELDAAKAALELAKKALSKSEQSPVVSKPA